MHAEYVEVSQDVADKGLQPKAAVRVIAVVSNFCTRQSRSAAPSG